MDEVSQQKHLMPARFDHFQGFLPARVILAYFLESYHAFAELYVLRFVNGAHLICTEHVENTVALLNDDIGEEQASEGMRCGSSSSSDNVGKWLATGKTMCCLGWISCTTCLTIDGERNFVVYIARHICTVPSSLPEAMSWPSGDHVTDVT